MEETEYWFHGTNHESARNIAEDGIMLGKAKAFMGADFSYGKSFYITNDFDFAKMGQFETNKRCHFSSPSTLESVPAKVAF